MNASPSTPPTASAASSSVTDISESPDPALSTRERALLIVRRVPLLAQAVRSGACSQDALVDALAARKFAAGEYINAQGQTGARELFFLERGRVLLTKRRHVTATSGATTRLPMAGRCRSQADADMETQVDVLEPFEYFGELPLLSNAATRATNAVAISRGVVDQAGEAEDADQPPVACFVMSEDAFVTLLAPLHELMLARVELRTHRVLDRERLFQTWSWPQKRFVLERCAFARFQPGARICEQSDTHDDRFFIVVEGEADVVMADDSEPGGQPSPFESDDDGDGDTSSAEDQPSATVVARKCRFQSFGEMALLGRPRVASVIAVGPSPSTGDGGLACVIITRALYTAAKRLRTSEVSLNDGRANGKDSSINDRDDDDEAALASTLADEWALAANARKLRLSNPRVARHFVTFIQHFKAAYQQLFEGKSAYLDLLRRLRDEPELVHGSMGDSTGELSALVERIVGSDTSLPIPLNATSLGVVRAETRRVLALPPSSRSAKDVALITRLVERSTLIAKIERPAHVLALQVARTLAQVVTFVRATKDRPLVRQGRVESRAFLILRGKINIVNERSASGDGGGGSEVLATLRAGDSFGELSLVAKLRRSASAFAPTSADLIAFDREHLVHIQREIPGVSVQHLMVERAEFLARLSFMKPTPTTNPFGMESAQDEAFGERIRVAHDVVERSYGSRHRFFQDEGDRRALLIVKSGEIGVFMRKQLHVQFASVGATTGAPSPSSTSTAAATRTVLVRVATIGPQEIFSATIATLSASPSAAADEDAAELEAATMYVSYSHAQVLELPERGWRRLRPASVVQIRRALLERYRWNADAATSQRYFYHFDRPWQLVGTSTSSSASGDGCACSDGKKAVAKTATTSAAQSNASPKCQETIEPVTTTRLVRHINDKKRHTGRAGAYVNLFADSGGEARAYPLTTSGKTTTPVRCASPTASVLPALPAVCSLQAPVTTITTTTPSSVHNALLSISMAAWEKDSSPRPPATSPPASSSALGGLFSPNSSASWTSRSLSSAGGVGHNANGTSTVALGLWDRHSGTSASAADAPMRFFAHIAPPPGSAAARNSPRVLNGRRRQQKQQQQQQQQPKTTQQGTIESPTKGHAGGDKFHAMWKLDRRTSLS